MPDLVTIAQIGSITTAALGLTTTLVTRTFPWLRTKITSRAVTRRLGTILTEGQVERAVRYYVEPMCQDVDPAGAEEPRLVFGVRQRLFKVLDDALMHPTEFRYIFLLADSGMGKSSAVINYYARRLRGMRRDFEIEVVPLGIPDADERIAAITDKSGKVLFLDAFDEDTLAIVDHLERLRNLLRATKEFRRVLITCRTQFFGKDEEIPIRTGLIKVGARGPGEPAEYFFHKIYLSPFGDAEIKRYIRKRYSAWHIKTRRKASRMVARVPNLTVRPMLLAHIDDLIREKREVASSAELYEEMVEAWLRREEGFVRNKDDLRRFSESLAIDIYLNRGARGAERVTRAEIETLAPKWHIPIESWALTGRSLLNRDAEGNYKFAHRSIMEYLFVIAFLRGEPKCILTPWTDQMKEFFVEISLCGDHWLELTKIFSEPDPLRQMAQFCFNILGKTVGLFELGTTRWRGIVIKGINDLKAYELEPSADEEGVISFAETIVEIERLTEISHSTHFRIMFGENEYLVILGRRSEHTLALRVFFRRGQ